MSDLTYSQSLLRHVVAKLAYDVGFHSAHTSAIDTLAEVLETYVFQICCLTKDFAQLADKDMPDIGDLDITCKYLSIDFGQLKDYVVNVDSIPLQPKIPIYPVPTRQDRTKDYKYTVLDRDSENGELTVSFTEPFW